MRLIHTSSLNFHEFEGSDIPKYAILSHTWGEEAVTFALYRDEKRCEKLRGWQKIICCCEKAKLHELAYVWMDTCCIDKSSSAEL